MKRWILLAFPLLLSATLSAKESYRMIAPELASQEETFTGRVVAVTDSGEVPLGEGDRISFQGQVVPVGKGGTIQCPDFFKEAGNHFLIGQIWRAGQKYEADDPLPTTTPHHIEYVPVTEEEKTDSVCIARAPQIVTATSEIKIEGQNLSRLESAMLMGEKDTVSVDLVAGSSLQQIYVPRPGENFPKGEYQFVGFDSFGHKYNAPNKSKNPQLSDVSGTEITHVGQKGKIRFRSNTNTYVRLEVEPPLIEPKEPVVFAPENKTTTVEFISRQVGNYTVDLKCMNAEDIPDSLKKSRVDSKSQPIETRYDPKKDSTFITAPVQIVDENGKAVKNVPVDMVVSGPGGVQFSRASTNRQGIAKVLGSFPGQIASSAITASVYRVLEHAWKQEEGSRLRLVTPEDGGGISGPTPRFGWLYMGEAVAGLVYDLKICEVAPGQKISDAIHNPPVLEKTDLTSTSFQYTGDVWPFVAGADYCWQVTVTMDDKPIAISNIGSFICFCYQQTDPCQPKPSKQKCLFSRGNNDEAEMKQQHANTGKWMYETMEIVTEVTVDPADCRCVDPPKECRGKIKVSLDFTATLRENWPQLKKEWLLFSAPAPPGPTQAVGGGPPSPNLRTDVAPVDLPAAANASPLNVVQGNLGDAGSVMNWKASQEISCKKGDYRCRFIFFNEGFAGQAGLKPGEDFAPASYVDCNITIHEKDCKLEVKKIETFFLDFVPGYDFTHSGACPGAPAELPEINLGGGNKTRNIAKVVECDGNKVDKPFDKKVP